MEKILNFRPLAEGLLTRDQKKIKTNMIFRSGAPDRASLEDIKHLHVLGIKHIYDLRRDVERTTLNPDLDIECLAYEKEHKASKPFSKSFLEGVAETGADQFMNTLYEEYLPFSSLAQAVIKDILIEERPFLIHCQAGKDRTGMIGAIIMMILGFDEQSIKDEFIKIDQRMIDYAVEALGKQGYTKEQIENLMPIHTVRDSYMEHFFKGIHQKYDSIEQYLNGQFGIDDMHIESFKQRFLVSKE